jgi:hypothetical protein
MNRTQQAFRALIAMTALAMLPDLAHGQGCCPCQPRLDGNSQSAFVAPQELTISFMHRDGWTRDPFTGNWMSVDSQTQVSKTNRAEASKTTETHATDASRTKSGASGSAAYGGGSSSGGSAGGGGSAGSIGKGVSGGGTSIFSGGTRWTPPATGSGGNVGGSFGGGSNGATSSGALSDSQGTSAGSSTRSVDTPVPVSGFESTQASEPTSVPTLISAPDTEGYSSVRLAAIPQPECPSPPLFQDIPTAGGDPVSATDSSLCQLPGEAPIVPEPGSIVLLGIAISISGAGYIRRCRNSRTQVVPTVLSGC